MKKHICINIVYEDEPSGEAIRKILETVSKSYIIGKKIQTRGFGKIKKNIRGYNHASKGMPYFVLVDLDQEECPPIRINKWFPNYSKEKNKNFIFRIAVKEIEAWLLADIENFAAFFHIEQNKINKNPEILCDPKAHIFKLIKDSGKKELIKDMLPKPKSTARIGPGYNARIIDFIIKKWNPYKAEKMSVSLKRTMEVLKEFEIEFQKRE